MRTPGDCFIYLKHKQSSFFLDFRPTTHSDATETLPTGEHRRPQQQQQQQRRRHQQRRQQRAQRRRPPQRRRRHHRGEDRERHQQDEEDDQPAHLGGGAVLRLLAAAQHTQHGEWSLSRSRGSFFPIEMAAIDAFFALSTFNIDEY